MKFSPNTNIKYIHNQKADRIRILNIFISSNLTEYEYQIYLFLGTGPNTNIEYICSQQLGWIQILSIYKANFEGPPPSHHRVNFQQVCYIFMQTWGVSAAWWSGYTKKNTFVERFHRLRILNKFVPHNLTEYEYQINLFLPILQNMNIKYIRS